MQTVKLADFLEEYRNEIAQGVIQSYPPIYTFDKRDKYTADIKKLKRKPYVAQFDAIAALAELFSTDDSGIAVGEMGCGKSLIAIVVAYICKFKKIIIMCPPHLVKKWEREIIVTLPDNSVECHHLKKFPDVEKAIAISKDNKFHFYIVGRERAKLSYQWRPAYIIKDSIIVMQEEGKNGDRPQQRRVKMKYISCPKCGGYVLDDEGIPLMPDDLKKKKNICARCGEFLWQAKETGPRRFAIAEYIKRKHKGFFDLLVVDECFPKGVKVKTFCGDKNIEDIRVGDYVLSSDGENLLYKKVVRTIKKFTTEPILNINHKEGFLPCTGNHKIFTERGEIRAEHITENDKIYYTGWGYGHNDVSILRKRSCEEWLQILFKRMFCFINDRISKDYSLQGVWQRYGYLSRRKEKQKILFEKVSIQQHEEISLDKNVRMVRQEHDNNSKISEEKVLQPHVHCSMENVTAENKGKAFYSGAQKENWRKTKTCSSTQSFIETKYIGKNEIEESYAFTKHESKGELILKRKAIPNKAWRKGNGAASTTNDTVVTVMLADGSYDQDRKRKTPVLLQRRFGKFRFEDRYRMRRAISRNNKSARERSKEGQVSTKFGMDCTEIQKQGNYGRCKQCDGTNRAMRKSKVIGVEKINSTIPICVYNLEVEETHNYFANGVLVSNCHEYRGRGSAQGYAAGILADACKKTLALTGTLSGGYSSTLFHLLFRLTKRFKDDYKHDDVRKWIDHYGIWETVSKHNEDEYNDNSQSKGRKYARAPREKPGISPVILPKYLLDKTVFIRLGDIAIDLPPLTEEVVDVEMSENQSSAYQKLYSDLKGILIQELRKGNKSLLAVYLQALLTYPDRCTKGEYVYSKEEENLLLASAPELDSDVLYPKERAIIELIQREMKAGRKVLVFCTHTNRRDVTARLQEKIQSAGIRSEILKSSIAAEKREEWLLDHGKDLDCIITNPALVQTGLDIIEFPTIAYCQAGYSPYILRQSSRRSWRIGQDKPVKIYYFVYVDTMQEQALKLMSLKMKSSLIIEGEIGEEGLSTYNAGDDNLFYELAKNIVNNVSIDEGLDSIWEKEQKKKVSANDLLIEKPDDFKSYLNETLKKPIAKIKKQYNPEVWDKLYGMMMQEKERKQDKAMERREKRERSRPKDAHKQIGLF